MAEFEGGQPKIKNLLVEPGAGPSSLFILSDTNFIRRFTLFLIEWPPFEYTILLTIIGNILQSVCLKSKNGNYEMKVELSTGIVNKHTCSYCSYNAM